MESCTQSRFINRLLGNILVCLALDNEFVNFLKSQGLSAYKHFDKVQIQILIVSLPIPWEIVNFSNGDSPIILQSDICGHKAFEHSECFPTTDLQAIA